MNESERPSWLVVPETGSRGSGPGGRSPGGG